MTPLLLAVALEIPFRVGLPIGSAERGSHLGDMAYLFASLGADVSWQASSRIGLVLGGRYGLGFPAVCFGVDSCIASAGRDATLSGGARFLLPKLGPLAARFDARFGWESFGYVVSDHGASATRAYDGPIMELELAVPLRLGKRTSLVPSIGWVLGEYTSASLDAAVAHISGSFDRRAHGWLTLGIGLDFALF